MSYVVNKQVSVGLKINGQELDMAGFAWTHIAMKSHILYSLPTLDLVLIDRTQAFGDSVPEPVDGSLIEVQISRSQDDAVHWVPFRVFHSTPTVTADQSGKVYTISGYYDYPSFLLNRINKIYNGTSSSVFKTIMQAGNIPVVADTSADTMQWVCSSRTQAEFIRNDLVPYAYATDSSAFVATVSHLGTKVQAYYKDIAKASQSKPIKELANNPSDKTDFQIAQSSTQSLSGLFNISGGAYGMVSTGFDLTKGDPTKLSGVTTSKTSQKLFINSSIVNKNTPRQLFSPLNIGNVHDNYYKAYGQNIRLKSTYSQTVDVLLREFSGLDLFQTVTIKITGLESKTDQDDSLTSPYMIAGIGQLVTPDSYCERISTIRNSMDSKSTDLQS